MPHTASQPQATQVPDQALSGTGVASAVMGQSQNATAAGLPAVGSVGMGGVGADGRSRFTAEELAIVLSHYNIGVIKAVQEFPRGSRKAPKLVIRAESGMYLLKRRAQGKDDAYKVAFCHGLQLHLADRQFPLPHLIGTQKDNNSMLQWRGAIYELFEYIKGGNYDGSLEATTDSGKILALFHKLLQDYRPRYKPAKGSYHASRSVNASMQQIPKTMRRLETSPPGNRNGQTEDLVGYLYAAYSDAAKKVVEAGFDAWPRQIVHCDWHPGNMLFRGSRVVAVIDYDAARIQQRILDVANGALQFSILGGGDDPSSWPDYIDESRFKRFVRGYDSVPDAMLSRAELRIIPWLMMEALIAESVIPIAATGSFARMEGVGFMTMVRRKVHWLRHHADKLARAVDT